MYLYYIKRYPHKYWVVGQNWRNCCAWNSEGEQAWRTPRGPTPRNSPQWNPTKLLGPASDHPPDHMFSIEKAVLDSPVSTQEDVASPLPHPPRWQSPMMILDELKSSGLHRRKPPGPLKEKVRQQGSLNLQEISTLH